MVRQFRLQGGRLDLLHAYERILVASQHMADEYARHGLGDKVRLLSLPIESTTTGAQQIHDDATWRLLYLGRLEQTKGVHIALESAAIVATATERLVHLDICGEGSLQASLRARAAKLMQRCPNLTVTLTGWLHEDEARRAISRTDLLLMPSCWPEPFGMVGLEAALQGVPSVAFAVGGIPEWLTDGVNGRLVTANPADAGRFAEAIRSCLLSPSELSRLRQQSVNTGTRFGLAAHVKQLEDILAEVVVTRARARRSQ
jgi:glycosyltransferase involved in cell wall biosynthesis